MIGNFVVLPEQTAQRLDMVMLKLFPNLSRTFIKKIIDEENVLVNDKPVKAGFSLKFGQVVSYEFEDLKPLVATAEKIDFEIVYEDKDLLVINKPQGLVVHPCASTKTGTLVNGLLYAVKDLSGINGVLRPGIIHRLDKNTSGLMLVAKNDFSHRALATQIKDKSCQRKYLALLEGNLKVDEGEIETFLDRSKNDRKKYAVSDKGKLAITTYRVIKRFEKNCLVEFTLKTGRTHQIRVHSKYLNHPIVGDDVYGHAEKDLSGQLLHSYYINFEHPRSRKRMEFTIDLPDYFKAFITKLKSGVLF